MSLARLAVLAVAAALAACTPEPAPAPLPGVALEDDGPAEVLPGDTTPGRDRRRMDIDQLAASIEQVTGGIRWTDERGADRFEQLAATLGKPDYASTTQEDLSPSLLFQKFLDDAAAQVCTELVAREASGGERVLRVTADRDATWQTDPAAIEADLSAALLRFHGRRVAPGDPQLQPWTWLFRTTHKVTDETDATWRTVCVALLTHPDFYTY